MTFRLLLKRLIGKSIKTIPDHPFTSRLAATVIGCGMLQEGNKYLMDFAIKNMPEGGDVLEIGAYGGLSSCFMLWLLKKYNRTEKLLCCDPWIYEGYEDSAGIKPEYMDGHNDVLRTDYMTYIKQSFVNAHLLLNKDRLPYTFELESDVLFEEYRNNSSLDDLFGRKVQLPRCISFAYIDGNHAEEAVRRDFENVEQFLIKGGFVLFDDSIEKSGFGSARFMTKMKSNRQFKLVGKNPNHLFQKIY